MRIRVVLIYVAVLYAVLNYTTATDCGKQIHNSSHGFLRSPGYPKSQQFLTNCLWEIQGIPGSVISIRFNDVDIEEDDMKNCSDDGLIKQQLCCASNWLKIGVPENEQPLVLCGRNTFQKTYLSTGPIVWIKYHTSASLPRRLRRGFNLTYSILRPRVLDSKPCLSNETTCYLNSHECYPKCDHIMHCANGVDEMGCVKGCQGRVMCDSWNGCYTADERCNGVVQCGDHSDERNCSPDLCRSDRGGFLCNNRQCIRESWQCDQTNDCGDNSDELNCLKNSVITAAVMGSLICGLLLVIAVGCTCKLYALRYGSSPGSSRSTLALSPLEREMLRREPPPPYSIAVSQAPANFFQQVATPPHLLDPFHFTRLCRGSHHRRVRRVRRQRRRPPTPPPSCLLVVPPDVTNSVPGDVQGIHTISGDGSLPQPSTSPDCMVYIPPGSISVGRRDCVDKLLPQVHGEGNPNVQHGDPSEMQYALSLARPVAALNTTDQMESFPIVTRSDPHLDDDDSPLLLGE